MRDEIALDYRSSLALDDIELIPDKCPEFPRPPPPGRFLIVNFIKFIKENIFFLSYFGDSR